MSDIRVWRIAVSTRAEKELLQLPRKDQGRVRAAIDRLGAGFPGGDVKKLKGRENEWRLRVGDWRIRFRPDFDERVILILHVLARGAAYRE